MNLGNLDFNIGGINPSGIGVTIYRVAKKDITSWPTVNDDPNGSGSGSGDSLSKMVGDFTLASGKKWDKIYSTQGKGKATFETIGETDCMMVNNKLTLSFPDLTAEALGFSKAAMNGDFVYVVKSAGRYHVIGSKDYRTVTQPAGDTGDAAGSAKGCTIEITAPDVTPLPIYQGVIVTADGSLDCATDTFTPAA